MALSRPFKEDRLLQAIDGVVSLALCAQVVSRASQHFISFEKRAACEGCFSRQSICSDISLHSGKTRAIHSQEFLKVDVDHRHIPVWASHSQLLQSGQKGNMLTDFVRTEI